MSSPNRKPRVLVAGQIPPPISGQNLSIKRVLSILKESPSLEVDHWVFKFTPTWSNARKASVAKITELIRVWLRLIRLRIHGPIDSILYPVGGPHLTPALRDIALLPLALLLSKKVILHFRAAGLSEALPEFPRVVSFLLKKIYATCNHAVVLTDYGRRDPEAAGIKISPSFQMHGQTSFNPIGKSNPTVIISPSLFST